jgi:hypothetical protein
LAGLIDNPGQFGRMADFGGEVLTSDLDVRGQHSLIEQ